MHADIPTFSPPHDKIPEILDHLDSPAASLANVAHANNTTVVALSAWFMLPEIQERNARIDSAAAHRTRSLALRATRCGVAALHFALARAIEEEQDETISNHPKLSLAATRRRDLINRSTRTLMQVAPSLALAAPKLYPTPAKPDPAPHTHRLTTIITELDALTQDPAPRQLDNADTAPQSRHGYKSNRRSSHNGHSTRDAHDAPSRPNGRGLNKVNGKNSHAALNAIAGTARNHEHSNLNGHRAPEGHGEHSNLNGQTALNAHKAREKPAPTSADRPPIEISNLKFPNSPTPPTNHHQAQSVESHVPLPHAAVSNLHPTPAAHAASSPASPAPPPRIQSTPH